MPSSTALRGFDAGFVGDGLQINVAYGQHNQVASVLESVGGGFQVLTRGAGGVDRFPVEQLWVTAARASKYENGPTEAGRQTPPKLVSPSSARLILEASIKGAAVTWGNSALNCSHRCPRAARTSACESSSPRFCLNPRLIASCNESGITPGTSFSGTLPANVLTAPVPGMAWPGLLEPGTDSVCARDIAAPQINTPWSRTKR